MELDNMAVDPDYFRRGYGSTLCKHGMDIATERGFSIGVIASASGAPLYQALDCTTVTKETVRDDRPDKQATVDFWVMKWSPPSKSTI